MHCCRVSKRKRRADKQEATTSKREAKSQKAAERADEQEARRSMNDAQWIQYLDDTEELLRTMLEDGTWYKAADV